MMRVTVDHDICEANGICEDVAPNVFHLRDDDVLQVLQPKPSGDDLDAARNAIHRCPRQALRDADGEAKG